jgi:hypothetical protein
MCIAAGILIESIRKSRIIKKSVHVGIIAMILIFGFVSTTLLIINDISHNQFQALSYVLENYDDDITILTSPVYSWILYDVFQRDNVSKDYSSILFYPPITEKTIIMVDEHYRIDLARGPQLQNVLDRSIIIQTFEGSITGFNDKIYPYTSMQATKEADIIEIREYIRVS